MILLRRKSNSDRLSRPKLRDEPYLILNLIFAVVIILIIAYSGIFSPDKNNFPVVCIHEKITGKPCFSCGLSHSFSLIVRGRIGEAYKWNIYGMRVFLFFILQLILRVAFSFYYIRYPGTRLQLIIADSTGSGMLFIITFWPFLVYIVETFVKLI